MSEMVERVAQALAENRRIRRAAAEHEGCACMGPPEYCQCEQARDLADARSAISAMREPTPGMVEAGDDTAGTLAITHDYSAYGTWQDMIDAALEEKPAA